MPQSNYPYKLKNTKSKIKHPIEHLNSTEGHHPEILEKESKVSGFELSLRALISGAIIAVVVWLSFFTPISFFAICVITPFALKLASDIIKKPTQNYIQENPNGFFSKFVGLLTGARDQVRKVSKAVTKDETAFENIAITAATAQHKGLSRIASGIDNAQVISGNGTKEQEQRFLKDINNKAPTSNKIAKKGIEKAAPIALKEIKKPTNHALVKQKIAHLSKRSAQNNVIINATENGHVTAKEAKQTLAAHGARDFKIIPKHQLRQINKLAGTPKTNSKTDNGLTKAK